MSFSEEDVENMVKQILQQFSEGLTFEELRDRLENRGVYVDGLRLRRMLSRMIRLGVVCKRASSTKRKLLLELCRRAQGY